MTRVLPVAGRAVYLPNTLPPQPLPADGVDVVLDAFWLRRLRDGDVRLDASAGQGSVGSGESSGSTGAQTGGTSGGTGGSAQTGGTTTGSGVDQTARAAAAAAQAKADAAIAASTKGAAGGVATLGQDGKVPQEQLGGQAPDELPSAASASSLVGVASDGSLVRVLPSALGAADGVEPDALPSATSSPELVGIDLDGGLVRLITPALAGPLASLPVAGALGDTDQVPVFQAGAWKRMAGSALKAAGTGATSPATAPSTLALDGAGWSGKLALARSVRRLRSAYAGPCLRVRRGGDGSERDFGFTGDGWLDGAAVLAFVGSGSGFVSKWYDQSGQGRDAVGPTPERLPLIADGGVVFGFGSGNRPGLRSDADRRPYLITDAVPLTGRVCAGAVANASPYGSETFHGNAMSFFVDAASAATTYVSFFCTSLDHSKLSTYRGTDFFDFPASPSQAGFAARLAFDASGLRQEVNGVAGGTVAAGAFGPALSATGQVRLFGAADADAGYTWHGCLAEDVLGLGVADADLAALAADQRVAFGV